jgi:hypothetical protein
VVGDDLQRRPRRVGLVTWREASAPRHIVLWGGRRCRLKRAMSEVPAIKPASLTDLLTWTSSVILVCAADQLRRHEE